MVPTRSKLAALVVWLSALFPSTRALAQQHPFPQTGAYAAGLLPAGVTPADAQAVYDRWKSEYVLNDCGGELLRVQFGDPSNVSPWTVSEGMGYGLVLAAYFGDRATYEGLWAFVKEHLNGDGMMGWKASCTGFAPAPDYGETQATDGDTDIAFSLVVAAAQWGSPYDAEAATFLAALKAHDFEICPNGRTMANNGFDTGCNGENSSYWMPGYYRVFGEVTGDSAFWNKAADDAVALWLQARDPTTGLIANEIGQDGSTSGPDVVDYNGCRIPWRAVLDYLWYGTAGARDVAGKITAWVDSVGEENVGDGYHTDGSSNGHTWNRSECFTGGYATGAMASTQARLDEFTAYFTSQIGVDNYYHTSLRALYTLMLSGAMWKPGAAAVVPGGGSGGGTGGSGSAGGTGSTDNGGSEAGGTKAGGGCGQLAGQPGGAGASLALGLAVLLLARRRA